MQTLANNLLILKFSLLVLAQCFLTSCSSGNSSGSSLNMAPQIQTTVGVVQGLARTYNVPASTASYTVYEYRGIPYAKAPIGDLRWALPRPVTSLGDGVFQAYDFGPACPQNPRAGSPEKYVNEDCLSINVTIPADIRDGEKLPVFFWIHGGAFVGGSSNLYRLDKLANDGRIIVVSSNYRLGVLGFMANDAFAINGYNGNYGLEDQRLAMKWVQDNIANFGGDKNNVTIAGESAGAGSVCMHLASPNQTVSQSNVKLKDLFQKAITQSGGCMQTLPTVAEGSVKMASIQESLCPTISNPTNAAILACMRSQSVENILNAQEVYARANSTDVTAISPVTGLGSYTVPLSFKDASAADQLVNVPMIMGGTKSELVLYVGYFWQAAPDSINASTIDNWLNAFYSVTTPVGGLAAIKAQYPDLLSADSNVVAETYGQALSDYNPQLGINNCLFLYTSDTILGTPSRSNPIYQFEFADPNAPVCGVGMELPCAPFPLGPVHSSELNYFFPNLSFTSKINASDLTPASQKLANQMVSYWTNFVRTGNPNQSDLPQWPIYSGATQAYGGASVLLLEPDNVRTYNSDTQHKCTAFWRGQYPSKLH